MEPIVSIEVDTEGRRPLPTDKVWHDKKPTKHKTAIPAAKSHRIPAKIHRCEDCGQVFCRLSYLTRHQRQVHKNIYEKHDANMTGIKKEILEPNVNNEWMKPNVSNEWMETNLSNEWMVPNVSNEQKDAQEKNPLPNDTEEIFSPVPQLEFENVFPVNSTVFGGRSNRFTAKIHRCEDCGDVFCRLSYLTRHQRQVHKNIYEKHDANTSGIKKEIMEHNVTNEWKDAQEKNSLPSLTEEIFSPVPQLATEKVWPAVSVGRPHRIPAKIHRCEECGQVFCRLSYLTHHQRQVHKNIQQKLDANTSAPMEHSIEPSLNIEVKEDREEKKPFPNDSLNMFCAIPKLEDDKICPEKLLTKNKSTISVARARRIPAKFHVCEECGQLFCRLSYLTRHQRQVHQHIKPFTCDICGKGFPVAYSLTEHLRTHTGEKPYACVTCGKSFALSCSLTVHTRTHTGEKPHICNICGKGFPVAHSLTKHMLYHSGERPYICGVCGKCFRLSRTLVVHLRVHTKERPYICEVCGKGFTQSGRLVEHMRTHTGEKPYICDVCGKAFNVSGNLTNHKRSHTGEKPYVCETCGKGFCLSGDLTKHKEIHDEGRSFPCKVCGKTFVRVNHLEAHELAHTGERPFVCGKCGKEFCYASSLRRHRRVQHAEINVTESLDNPEQIVGEG